MATLHTTGTKKNYATKACGTAYITERIALPLPPPLGEECKFEMEIYATFMRHLRHVPNSRMEIKILSAIQFTADTMDIGDALVAKTLVDLGLRAPRKAFPVAFLDFVDRTSHRKALDHSGTACTHILDLREHWDLIGEDRFAPDLRTKYAAYNETMFV